MRIYLSSDRNDEFFITAVKNAVDKVNASLQMDIELVFPPTRLGVDTGKVLGNVLHILDAQIALINVTPRTRRCLIEDEKEDLNQAEGMKTEVVEMYNSGVMIEYGMATALEYLQKEEGASVQTKRAFCDISFSRKSLCPVVNEDDVLEFDSQSADGRTKLEGVLDDIIRSKVKDMLRMKPVHSKYKFQ